MATNTAAATPSVGWIKPDLYQTVTNHFIKLFHHAVIPWRQGTAVPFHGFAQNYHSGQIYRGINWLLLNLLEPNSCPYYLTRRQVQRFEGNIVKGTRARQVYYFNTYYRDDQDQYLTVVQAQQLELSGKDVHRISYLKQHFVY